MKTGTSLAWLAGVALLLVRDARPAAAQQPMTLTRARRIRESIALLAAGKKLAPK